MVGYIMAKELIPLYNSLCHQFFHPLDDRLDSQTKLREENRPSKWVNVLGYNTALREQIRDQLWIKVWSELKMSLAQHKMYRELDSKLYNSLHKQLYNQLPVELADVLKDKLYRTLLDQIVERYHDEIFDKLV